MEVYIAPRAVVKHAVQSAWAPVANGVVAGCGRAVALIRSFLYNACSVIHTTFPDIMFREYIDDLVLTAVGEKGLLARRVSVSSGSVC